MKNSNRQRALENQVRRLERKIEYLHAIVREFTPLSRFRGRMRLAFYVISGKQPE